MKIIFMGGTGFVGKSFAHWVTKNDIDVELVLASRNPVQTAGAAFLKLVSNIKNVRILPIHSSELVAELQAASHVIYAASSSDQRNYMQAGLQTSQNDLESLETILRIMRRRQSILYLSSGAVYGRQNSLQGANEYDTFPLWAPNDPKAVYASIKRQAEARIVQHSLLNESPSIIARLFAFCGPWLPTSTHFLIGNIIGAIEARAPVKIRSSHPIFRTYLHSDEMSSILFALLNKGIVGCDVVNVGALEHYEMHEVGVKIANLYNLESTINKIQIGSISDLYIPSVKKLEAMLGHKTNWESIYKIIARTLEQRKKIGIKNE